MNDPRQFLPIQTSEGLILHIQKPNIAKIVQLNQKIEQDSVTDPYEILGASRNMGDTELKETFRNLCNIYHPDKLMSLNMAPEIVDLANSRTIRVIDAYHRILAERRKTDRMKVDHGSDRMHQQRAG